MSRNNDRQGVPTGEALDDVVPTPHATMNPPGLGSTPPNFQWAVPTYFVTLPSGALYYEEGHPCHGKTKLELRYMTAKEEDILTSEQLLKEGVAVTRAIQNLFVDTTIDIRNLLIQDVNALMIGARITGYGSDYPATVQCPSCGDVNEFSFNLEEALETSTANALAQAANLPTPIIMENGDRAIEITLPLTKAVVGCKLLTGADEERVAKESQKKNNSNNIITQLLRNIIVSVNGETNLIAIANLIHTLPTRDSAYIRKTYMEIVPTFNLEQQYTCQSCGHTADTGVPLNANFFWS
jgi:hypothetical protein